MKALEKIPKQRGHNRHEFFIRDTMNTYLVQHPDKRWRDIAERAGLDPASVSKYKTGQYKMMQKNTAIRLAIAMELDWEQMQSFVHAAGYIFPHDGLDYAIMEIAMVYRGKSVPYYEFLFCMEPNPEFQEFLDSWFR